MSQPPMVPPEQPAEQYPVPYRQQFDSQGFPMGPKMYPQPYAVVPKNPGLALVASFFIPGLGSLINGAVGMGIVIFVSYILAWVSMAVLIGLLLVPAVWVWGMVDAYNGAKTWNRQHGILS